MGRTDPPTKGRADKQTADNRDPRQSGTALATYSYTTSCERYCGWGGARNRADRASDHLTDEQVRALLDAAAYAISTGRTFQRHWTIHYGKAGIEAENGARFVSKVLTLARKQARREGGKLAALWVRERASDKGEHVHIVMHLPAGMRLHGRTRRWIEAAGGKWQPGVSCVTIIGGLLSKTEANNGQHHMRNASQVVCYLLKASSNETGQRLELTRSGMGGRIIGKRCGWTQNIGAKARGDA